MINKNLQNLINQSNPDETIYVMVCIKPGCSDYIYGKTTDEFKLAAKDHYLIHHAN